MTSDGIITILNEAAATYDQVGVDFGIPMGAELVHRARIRPGDRILDVGCGRGAVLLPAAEAAGPSGEGFAEAEVTEAEAESRFRLVVAA